MNRCWLVDECFATYRSVTEHRVELAEQPGVLLQNRVKIDRYNVLRRDVQQVGHFAFVVGNAPPVREVPATLRACLYVVVEKVPRLFRQLLRHFVILPGEKEIDKNIVKNRRIEGQMEFLGENSLEERESKDRESKIKQ